MQEYEAYMKTQGSLEIKQARDAVQDCIKNSDFNKFDPREAPDYNPVKGPPAKPITEFWFFLRECESKLCSLSSKKALEGEEIVTWMEEVY